MIDLLRAIAATGIGFLAVLVSIVLIRTIKAGPQAVTKARLGALGREARMVPAGGKAFCDPEIEPLVRALNEAGIETVASCSGHGFRPGNIALRDGRELIIAADFAEARKIDALFPTDINGNHRAHGEAA